MKLAVGNQVCLRPLFCAFLAPKRFRAGALSRAQTPDRIPTTPDLRTAPAGRQPRTSLRIVRARLRELRWRAKAKPIRWTTHCIVSRIEQLPKRALIAEALPGSEREAHHSDSGQAGSAWCRRAPLRPPRRTDAPFAGTICADVTGGKGVPTHFRLGDAAPPQTQMRAAGAACGRTSACRDAAPRRQWRRRRAFHPRRGGDVDLRWPPARRPTTERHPPATGRARSGRSAQPGKISMHLNRSFLGAPSN